MNNEMISRDISIQKPNPRATIGFVIYYPFQFYVYKNIYEKLKDDAEFIVDLCHPFSKEDQETLLRNIVDLLKRHDVHYRVLYHEDYYQRLYLRSFFSRYTALVSVWLRGCMNITETVAIKKVCAMYGGGKELTMVNPYLGKYDLILSFGERSAKLHSYYTKAKIVGNPKFDDWFGGSIDASMLTELEQKCDHSKKTLLYLPTHSDLSSLDMLTGELGKLKADYNVIVKTHYYTTREEPERVARLREQGVIIYTDEADLLPLLKVADVVLSDNSSAIFDAVLADKPIIVADFWDPEFLDLDHKELQTYTRGIQGAVTYSGSIEQVIKRNGWVQTVKKAEELSEKLAAALEDGEFYKQKRKDLRAELFAFNDGECAKRAAEAIRDCIADTQPRIRPILYHALEAYKRQLRVLSFERERYLTAKLARYEALLNERIPKGQMQFSVIYLQQDGIDSGTRSQSLRSIFYQDLSGESYEIIPCGVSPEELEDFAATLKISGIRPAVRGVPSDGPLSKRLLACVKAARGAYVCFASDTCMLPSDWLSTLYLTYAGNPATVGAGGYVYVERNKANPFDEYYYRGIAKQLNIARENPVSFRFLYEVTNRLFFQNPAGDLRAMSYRRDVIPPIPQAIDDPVQLGLYIKCAVMKESAITFIPHAVIRLLETSKEEFKETERLKWFFYRMYRTDIEQSWSYQPVRPFAAAAEAIQVGIVTKGLSLPYTVVLAAWMQLTGTMQALKLLSKRMAGELH